MSIGKSSINRTTKTIAPILNEEIAKNKFTLSEIKVSDIEKSEVEAGDKLIDSVRKYGILEPVTVARYGEDKFLILSGEKRISAALSAGFEKVPCVVIDAKDKKEAEKFRQELIQTAEKKEISNIHEAKFIAATSVGQDMPDFLL